ncbi:MAG TPA: hypothetical protein VK934_05150 [Fimbriimonas sp.]|nr:hypothetical protein [Fimbriimonas sp.]
MHTRLAALAFCGCLLFSVVAAQDGGRLSKEAEKAKYHSPVHGMDAATRLVGFAKRQQMEKDSHFGGLMWRNIGPESQGGRVIDIHAPLDNPDKLYVAFATGGLWRTEDDGNTWVSLFDDQSSFGIGAFAVSNDGKTIWVGTGEANSQRTSYAGTGVFKSSDEGKTWQYMGLGESHHIGNVLIDPKNPSVVYVASLGHLYSQNPDRGVYKTTDGGKTWSQVLKVDEWTGAFDIAMDPKNPSVLIATMWERDRRAWNLLESGKGSGTYRTDNGGKSWTKLTTLPEGLAAGRTDVAWAPSNSRVVYAAVDVQADDKEWTDEDERVPSGRLTNRRFLKLTDETLAQIEERPLSDFLNSARVPKATDVAKKVRAKEINLAQLRKMIEDVNADFFRPPIVAQEVYRSDDGGHHFFRVSRADDADYQYYFTGITVNPKNENDVLCWGFPMLRSVDGGKTWKRIAEQSHVDYHAAWFDPRNPAKLWIGNDGGLYVSGDYGQTTRHVNNLAVGQPTTVAVDNKRPYNVYIGLQDNGTMKGPSTYVRGRGNPNAWTSIGGGDGSHVAVDPRNDGDIVYTASQFGAHSALNQLTNERWNARPQTPRNDPAARFNWVSPLIVSSHHPDIVYCGAQRLYRSFNQGRNYLPISPDLTKNKMNGDVPFSTIKDISESPLKWGLIYVGADDGRVTITRDGGFTWADIPTPQPDKWVSRIVASKYDEGTVYVAQNGYREDDFAAYLYKSTDQGKSWQSIDEGLPAEPINVVREDPTKKDVLYVGTDMGVFVSLDGGKSWESLSGGIPNQPVHDLAVQARDNELVAATHGRSVFILPLKFVHELTPELREKGVSILDVPSVTRGSAGFRSGGDWGYENQPRWAAPMPTDPVARVTYFTDTAGKAIIRIKKDGKVLKEATVDALRGFNTSTISLMIEPAKPIPAGRPEKPKTGADALKDPYEEYRAKYLARGEYDIEVEVNGKVAKSTLRITAPQSGGGNPFQQEDAG